MADRMMRIDNFPPFSHEELIAPISAQDLKPA